MTLQTSVIEVASLTSVIPKLSECKIGQVYDRCFGTLC